MNKAKLIFLLSVAMVFTSCEKVFFEPQPENNPEALFEELWTTFKTDYAVFDERGVDWDHQYTIFRPQVTPATTDTELENIFKQMLRTLDDGHVSLTVPNKPIFVSNQIIDERIDDEIFNLDVIKINYLEPGFKETNNGANIYGKIGNIGYWWIKYQSDNYLETDEILNHFDAVDGLIIDLRHSGGGDLTYTITEFGRFTSEQRFSHRSKTKNGTGPVDVSEWYNWSVSPSGEYYDKPIVVLIDRYVISAAERHVLSLRTLPNVTFVGDTTSGGLSTKVGKELANGWFYSISPQKVESHDGQYFEGVGIPPDIYVKNTMTEINAGQDLTLEKALDQF